jgi:MFS family permease
VFWIISIGVFIAALGNCILFFIVPFVRSFGYSNADAGFAASSYGAGMLVSALTALADRFGRRETIVFGLTSAALFAVVLSQLSSLLPIFIFAFLVGATAWMSWTASRALIADVVEPIDQLAAFAVLRFFRNAGSGVGLAAAAFVSTKSFEIIFLVPAGLFLFYSAIAIFTLPRGQAVTDRKPHMHGMFRTVLADRRFMIFLAAAMLIWIVYSQSVSSFFLQVQDYGHSSKTYGLLLALNPLFVIVLELPITAIIQNRARGTTMAVGYALLGLGFFLTVVSGAIIWLALTVFLWTLGEMIAYPSSTTFTAEVSPEEMRGRYAGAHGGAEFLGHFIGPGLGAVLYSLSSVVLWTFCGIIGVVAALLALVAGKGFKPGVGGEN